MRYLPRILQNELLKAARHFSAIVLTGPRRAGKTTLFQRLFPKATYRLLEDPDLIERFRADPRGFLEELKPPVILDEIQNIPSLFNYVRTVIDRHPEKKGQWLFTGSQEAPLMRGVSESMAGRAAIFQLYPLSYEESKKVTVANGGFPEVLMQPSLAGTWFRSYAQTYLERDVRAIATIRDLSAFRRFLSLLASRVGQMLNKTDLAAPLGVSIPTIAEWLNILEITSQIIIVPPFYENFGKRLIKSPKVYFTDSGFARYLLGIGSGASLRKSPFFGALFEGFIASEIVKHQVNHGKRKEIYYFRDQQGLEVDFIVPTGDDGLTLIEVKAGKTVAPGMAASLLQLKKNIGNYKSRAFIIHQKTQATSSSVLHPDVQAKTLDDLPDLI